MVRSAGDQWQSIRSGRSAAIPLRETMGRHNDRVTRLVTGRELTLEKVVARAAGVDVGEISIRKTSTGRPVARGVSLDFNVSHADGLVVVALSSGGAVGVDIERADRRVGEASESKLAEDVLSEAERDWLESVSRALDRAGAMELALARSAALMQMWTVKEAVMKATGEGLRRDPFDIVCSLPSVSRVVEAGGPFIEALERIDETHSTGVRDDIPAAGEWGLTPFRLETSFVGTVARMDGVRGTCRG